MSAALDASVTLDDVLAVLAAKRVPLAPELAGYLVLEIAERADPSGGDIDPRSVLVGEEGTVAVVRPRRPSGTGDAEACLRAFLARLLETSGAHTAALVATGKRKSGAGMPALVEELETALVPVNRAAGRRALARLAREVRRVMLGVGRNALQPSGDSAPISRRAPQSDPRDEGGSVVPPSQPLMPQKHESFAEPPTTRFESMPIGPEVSEGDVDALIERFDVSRQGDQQHSRDLRAIVGLEPTPPPSRDAGNIDAPAPPAARKNEPPSHDADVDSLLALEAHSPKGHVTSHSNSNYLQRRELSQARSIDRTERAPGAARSKADRRGWVVALLAFALIGAGAYGVVILRPIASLAPASQSVPQAASHIEPPKRALPCDGTLLVVNVPPRAEVLLREGQAPVDVEKVPAGARLEFVATAEGYAPRRVVIPSGVAWDKGPDAKPRFEAAVQLERAINGAAEAWPVGEPGTEVGGQGSPGTVHVVATPRGAEIWMLAGIGPQAQIEHISCDRDYDVLIAGPGAFRKRLHVAAAEFTSQGDASADPSRTAKIAQVSAK
jgi:hypothetical protein